MQHIFSIISIYDYLFTVKREEKKRKKRRQSSSSSSSSSTSSFSSSSSSSSSSDEEARRKRKRRKAKKKLKKMKAREKKEKKKEKRRMKKLRKMAERAEKTLVPTLHSAPAGKPLSSLETWQSEDTLEHGPAMTDEQKARISTKRPMTKEQWEAQQSIIRRVVDPETGRTRLVRGEGEILEEIVSREKHKEINKQATKGDGSAFQKRLGINR
ncbi:hypothetical protein JZ751_012982 [Albula glossodonta]|uniref:ADP-ribosylation factor-like protein 6-interacting protein 4 n=1 Tax=Albula glossodonta TaxID=121402 RepID=A0A8T2N3Z3_9TELE|nr:hypothetical protein JZ751_012982 [Albula glossodonta]